jgi:hypothetical protein
MSEYQCFVFLLLWIEEIQASRFQDINGGLIQIPFQFFFRNGCVTSTRRSGKHDNFVSDGFVQERFDEFPKDETKLWDRVDDAAMQSFRMIFAESVRCRSDGAHHSVRVEVLM